MSSQIFESTGQYEITFKPKKFQLAEIKKWLIEEDIKAKSGFYCNWRNIKASFGENKIVIISQNGSSVGFATWRITSSANKVARVDYMEIKPSLRKKGIGKILINHLTNFLENENILVVDVLCAPAESEHFWKRMGFLEFPSQLIESEFKSCPHKKLYKILPDHLNPSFNPQSEETMELWQDEPYKTKNTPPEYVWALDFKGNTRKLSKPLIHPASPEWRIQWKIKNISKYDRNAKNFKTNLDFESFLILEELPSRE